jgi:hypothetical protein
MQSLVGQRLERVRFELGLERAWLGLAGLGPEKAQLLPWRVRLRERRERFGWAVDRSQGGLPIVGFWTRRRGLDWAWDYGFWSKKARTNTRASEFPGDGERRGRERDIRSIKRRKACESKGFFSWQGSRGEG